MFSLEPFTLQDLGSPQVFQTGETFQGAPLIDYQHPHDLVMALGGRLERPVKGLRTLVEASLVGTPALGPPPFMHRPSAADNPQVPLSHHGLDSTHISSSVLTGGAWWRGVALEASWFHGKEPDENRLDLDLGPPDSWAARLSWASGPWRLQASGGRLTTPEVLHPYDETRLSASIGYDSAWRARPVSMLLAWGQKREPFGVFDNYLIEAHVQAGERDALFTRAEIVTKAILGGGIHAPGAQHFHPALEDRRAHRRLRARPHRRAAWPHRRGRRRHRLPRPGQPHRQLRPAALVPRLPALRRAAGTRDAASLSRRLRPRLDARRRRHVACAPGIRPTIRQSSLASPSEPGGWNPCPTGLPAKS
jgi:hypothetical protein